VCGADMVSSKEQSGNTADSNELAWLDFLDGRYALWKILAEVLKPIRGRVENYDREFATGQVLLVSHVSIQRDQYIKERFGEV